MIQPAATAQTVMASEPFASTSGALHGSSGGSGWAGPWEVQNSSTALPGYGFVSQNPLSASSGSYATGGSNWQSSGRPLGFTAGTAGQTVYVSLLMRKDTAADDDMSVTLHSGSSPAWFATGSTISVGYFGGTQYWSLKVNGALVRSTVPITVGQSASLVVRVTFGSTNVVSLFVDPPASSLPAAAAAEVSTAASVSFRSLAFYGGSGSGQSSIDELRFTDAWSTPGASVPAAPTGLTATPGDRQVSLTWNATVGATGCRVYDMYAGAPRLQASPATNSAVISGLTNRQSYTFYVVALNAAGAGAPSAQVTAVPVGPVPLAQPALGTNLSTITDYSREWPFVDAFKMARPWISQVQGGAWGSGPAIATDANGWPTSLQPGQYVETIIFDNALDGRESYPTGNYTLLYDGQGTIGFDLRSATIVSQSTGRMVVNVPGGTNGIYLTITATNPANPIRNIRLIMPGFENSYRTNPFHPLFLARLKNYKVLRFMEWMLINGSEQKNWADRPTIADYTYVWRGAPLEVMIQLANALGATPWFNIPAKATDDYVTRFAGVMKEKLSKSRSFYLEYSNETWNNGFSQAAWIRQQGVATGLSTDQYLAGALFTSRRSVEIFGRFETVFAGTSRMRRVIASQAANSWTSDQMLGYRNASAKTDMLAIAPYFNCNDEATGGFGTLGDPATASQVALMSVEQVNDIQLQHIQGCAMQQMTSSSAIARKYGVKMVAYEGGQSLVGYGGAENNAALTSLFSASNRSTRMGSLYSEYLQNWITAGGDLFVHFTDVNGNTKWGN
ncbi:MAG: fibronectin type III domain-containing protein, partial [Bryobacteraceae bacterium]|nr:fibronectin type III domain-containing protein [Bryobacteraceae bacterium]